MDLSGRLCFLTGKHTFEKWTYIANTGQCLGHSQCVRCNKTIGQPIDHEWSDWEYSTAGSCVQYCQCLRCGQLNTRQADHEWGDWKYMAIGSCEQSRQCLRCGQQGVRRTLHDWGPWINDDGRSCSPQHTCKRCAKSERGEAQHQWGPPRRRGAFLCDGMVEKCGRCGASQITEGEHEFEIAETHYDTDGTVLGYWSKCIVCGQDDYKKNKWHPRHSGA